jgi:hypothetical protein
LSFTQFFSFVIKSFCPQILFCTVISKIGFLFFTILAFKTTFFVEVVEVKVGGQKAIAFELVVLFKLMALNFEVHLEFC